MFGLSGDAEDGYEDRGFPWWATLPGYQDLSMGRRWHFFFAWLFLLNSLVYLVWSLGSGHLRPGKERDPRGGGRSLSRFDQPVG
jgi:thiosulfate reductase cytochrome b subunit